MTRECVIHNRILEDWFALYENGEIVEMRNAQKHTNAPDIGYKYIGIIRKVETRLNAVFVEIESNINAFLQFKHPRPKWVVEGKKIIVEIIRRAQADKSCVCAYLGDAPNGEDAPKIMEKAKSPKNWPVPFRANDGQAIQIETILNELKNEKIYLPNGGNFEISQTRAICAIDIDSNGREAGGKNQTHFNKTLNLEAAAAIAKQIRLRNLCGLIVIDFAGTLDPETSKKIEEIMRKSIGPQNAKFFFNFKLGLCEIARERSIEPIHEIFSKRKENEIIRGAIDAIYHLGQCLLTSKGQTVHLNVSNEILFFLNQCGYNWREHLKERIGGVYQINVCRENGFEVIIK